MKSLPATLGLPSDVDSVLDALKGDSGAVVIENARNVVGGARQYLGWLRTAPMPYDENVVAVGLSDACDAAMAILDSVPDWLATAEAVVAKQDE